MARTPSNEDMSIARLAELAERYGHDLAAWPRPAADAARPFLAASAEARRVVARARRLDEVLRVERSIAVSAGLRGRILAAAPDGGWRDLLASLWPFGPVWRPALGLLLIAALGVVLGSTDAASFADPISVNGALSEEMRRVLLSAADVHSAGPKWRE